MKRLGIIILIIGLAACGGGEGASADPASQTSTADSGMAVEIESEAGQFTLARLPDGFPLPIPDGVQIGLSAGTDTGIYEVTLIFPAERADQIADFYRKVFADEGYTIEKDFPFPDGGAAINARKDELFAKVSTSDRGGSISVYKILNP